MMDNRFDPAAVEARIREVWEKEGAFKAGRPERKSAKGRGAGSDHADDKQERCDYASR